MLQEKIRRIQKLIIQHKQEYFLVGNFGHQIHDDILYWLLLEKLEFGYMLIPKTGKPTLYAVAFEVEQLKHKRTEYLDIVPAEKSVYDVCLELSKHKTTALMVRANALPTHIYHQLSDIQHLTISHSIKDEQLMAVKEPKEIERMKQAAALTDIIFSELLKQWQEFYTEADAANYLLRLMADRGVEASFPPIIASGKHAAKPHHRPTYKQLQPGFCVIDLGVRFKGYCSDMTRTIHIGSPSDEGEKVYNQLLLAQEKTIQKIKPGIGAHELDDYCRQELGEELSHYFVHSLGHGIGSQVHEFPTVSKKNITLLEKDMVITVEPGVYVPHENGMRIEDEILVTENGYEVLTKTEKKLFQL